MKESDLIQSCLELLAYKKVWAWRNNTGSFKTERGGFYRMGLLGSADIFAIMPPNGTLIGIECKIKKNSQSPAQKLFQQSLESTGGLYWLIYDIETLVDKLEELKNFK